MHVKLSDWRIVTLQGLADMLLVTRVQVALIDVVVLRTNIELVSLIFREIHTRDVYCLLLS
jgi:hypothetical protein